MNNTSKIVTGIIGAGLLIGGGIALDNPSEQVNQSQIEQSGDVQISESSIKEYKKASEIDPSKVMTTDEKDIDFKILHGEAVLPESKEDKVIIHDRFSDREVDVEYRLSELEQIIKDAKANIDRTQGILSNASEEYSQLLVIFNR